MFNFQLQENEKLVRVYRQTETVLFKPVLWLFALIYFPWYFLLKYDLAQNFIRLLLFWTLLVMLYEVNKYLLWRLNVYLVTNNRLIQVAYQSLLNKKVLESPLDRILNVSFSSKGFWQSLFKFGAVEVQVAGLPEPIVLKNLKDPGEVKDFLWKAHNQFGQAQSEPQAQPQPIDNQPKIIQPQPQPIRRRVV